MGRAPGARRIEERTPAGDGLYTTSGACISNLAAANPIVTSETAPLIVTGTPRGRGQPQAYHDP